MTKHRVRKGRRTCARGYSPLNGLGTGGPKTRVPDARQHEQLGTNTGVRVSVRIPTVSSACLHIRFIDSGQSSGPRSVPAVPCTPPPQSHRRAPRRERVGNSNGSLVTLPAGGQALVVANWTQALLC